MLLSAEYKLAEMAWDFSEAVVSIPELSEKIFKIQMDTFSGLSFAYE